MEELKEGTIVKCWDNMGVVSLGKYKKSRISMHYTDIHNVDITWHPKTKNQSMQSEWFDNVEPVDFTEQFLPEGVKIGDKVEFWDTDDLLSPNVSGTLKAITSDGRFVDSSDTIWEQCKLLTKTKIVKPLNELMITLLDEGYEPNHTSGYKGDWVVKTPILLNLDEYPSFTIDMFKFCGKKPSERFNWRDSWLKEVHKIDKE